MNQKERIHGLDFCRAAFMILGVFYHAALIYDVDQTWRIGSEHTSTVFTVFATFIHDFRMEAFYVIAGFFYIYIFNKNRDNFLNERVKRALIPLLFCGLTINFAMNALSYEMTYDFASINYFLDGKWLGHLWFLGNLIVYFIVFTPFCKYITTFPIVRSNTLILIFILVAPSISILLLAISKYTISTQFIFVSFHSLLGYLPFFLLGCFCCRWKLVFLEVLKIRVFFLCLFIYLMLMLILNLEFGSALLQKTIERLSHGSLALAMIAIVYNLGAKEVGLAREISISSYTIYLLHQPLIIIIYVFIFSKLSLNIYIEYSLVVFLVIMVSYLAHRYFVSSNKLALLLLNGVYRNNKL